MNKKQGWDIADAVEEGIDPLFFIQNCPVIEEAQPQAEPDPFRCIGYDSTNYWFLLGNQRQPYAIQKGSFTGSKLGELAPPDWWAAHDCLGDKGAIDTTSGQRLVIDRQNAAGMFDADILRGAGVWIDSDKILINDGQRIVTLEGKTHDLAAHTGQGVYVRSSVRFGDMTGPESTDNEGKALLQLMDAQLWARPIDGVAALGWSLIAPFGGLLKFRPHIWISGRKGSGKTYVLDNIIREIVGPFGHEGSGKDTEAGIRRTLNMDARPVSLDEMEPKGKARENVTKILDLARNASSDGSGRVTMADGKGTVSFLIRSCFCFASVNTIASEGAAIASRIIACELEAPKTPAEERAKITTSKRLYVLANMANAARFRRRMFRAMPRILEDIAFLREVLPEHFGGTREADLWAPILAAAWAVQSGERIGDKAGRDWLDSVLGIEAATRQKLMEDEDKVIEHILSATIESDDRRKKSVAEWLLLAATMDEGYAHAADLLGRYGMKIIVTKEGQRCLAVATSSDALSRLLKDTPYEASYDAQIRRNALCVNPTNAVNQRFAGMQKTARLLEWHSFKEVYMGGAE